MFTTIHGACGRRNHTQTLNPSYVYLCQIYSPSQLASAGAQTLADKLTEPLRMTGDLEYATPGSMYAPVSLIELLSSARSFFFAVVLELIRMEMIS